MALVPILLSSRGLTAERDPSRIQTGDLLRAENVDFSHSNLLSKQGGTTLVTPSALGGAPAILTGYDFWPTATSQRSVIATGAGQLLKDSGVGTYATVLKSGLTTGRLVHLVEGGAEAIGSPRKLFALTGADPVQVLAGDGATTANLATPPADWTGANQPSFAFLFRGYLVGGGNANLPSHLYGSLGDDHEDFTSAGVWQLSVYPGVGERLVAGLTALGKGWWWKYPEGVGFIQDPSEDITTWFSQLATTEYGAADTPHAVAQVDQATIAFLTHTGSIVFMQETGGTLVGVSFVDLFKALNLTTTIRETMNLARLRHSQLRWYNDRKQLHVTYAGSGAVRQDRRLVIDFNSERTRVEISTSPVCESIWMAKDSQLIPRPLAGDAAGVIRRLDQAGSLIDGAAQTMVVQTTPTDFSDIDPSFAGFKELYRLHLEHEAVGDYTIPVEVLVDGRVTCTVNLSMAGGGGAVLPFELPAMLGGVEMRRTSREIIGHGQYVSLRLTDASVNRPRFARAWLEIEPKLMTR